MTSEAVLPIEQLTRERKKEEEEIGGLVTPRSATNCSSKRRYLAPHLATEEDSVRDSLPWTINLVSSLASVVSCLVVTGDA